MYDDYIEDAYYLASHGLQAEDEREKKRYYRASIFYSISAMEAFINYVGDTLSQNKEFPPYEIAFLTDRRFDIENGQFKILESPRYQRLEEKTRYLLNKFVKEYDFSASPWREFIEFKRFRDSLVHPRINEDVIGTEEYQQKVEIGIKATLNLIDTLCRGIFGKNLRKGLMELYP